MTSSSTNYFVCTLGQAALLGCTKPDQRIPAFLEEQSRNHPHRPAVGLYLPSTTSQDWDNLIITFRQLYHSSCAVAENYKLILSDLDYSNTIALLIPSCTESLFTSLALIQLGHPVLLLAPQCTPNAIAQLCQQCDVSILINDRKHGELAVDASRAAKSLGFHLEPIPLPVRDERHALDLIEDSPEPPLFPSRSEDIRPTMNIDVAYLHYTSDTSAGVPKPIPLTHRGAVGVLPRLDGANAATFSTTPLYHGGMADVFRAWTSNALIWLFPGKAKPITATNVVKCLEIAAQAARDGTEEVPIPPVRYFSSIPDVLQMMVEDPAGLKQLQSMDIVGVGGAALPAEVGDGLVTQEVNLASRFGTAECGFLMSSHRKYETDKEWQYLRPGKGVQNIRFEPVEHELSELVIEKGWPHMANNNRHDGSYATADLFAPHPSIPNAWKYYSRADSQLTLVTGKKFDPAPMEATLAATCSVLADVLIFGNGKPYPGGLVFRSEAARSLSDEEVKSNVKEPLEKMNKESQSHARISMDMVFVMPPGERGLEKSSKGTVLRHKAEDRFQGAIEKAYSGTVPEGQEEVPDEDLPSAVLKIVHTIFASKHGPSEQLTPETDLFTAGIDSAASVQIRQALARLLPKEALPLPLTFVQDTGTVDSLSKHLLSLRHGQKVSPSKDPLTLMRELVDKYKDFSQITPPLAPEGTTKPPTNETILLTGSTGSLGAHILSLMLSAPGVSHIYLLVRGTTLQAATERVRKSLTSRQLPTPSNLIERVTILPCRLEDPDLGLNPTELDDLRHNVTCIMHLAWDVNLLLNLQQFKKVHLSGLRHLLNLGATSTRPTPPKFIFCSSSASVSSHPIPVPEALISDPSTSGPTGYARSKWVAEQICFHASSSQPRLKDRITIMRVGQLSANSQTGVWNASESYPLMLSTAKKTVIGCLPDLNKARRAQGERGEELNWLPVDAAAQAFADVALGSDLQRQSTKIVGKDLIDFGQNDSQSGGGEVDVLHVLPPPRDQVKTWSSLLVAMKMAEGVNIVSIGEWLAKLEKLRDEKGADAHPSLKLLDFWRDAYNAEGEFGEDSEGSSLGTTITHISAIDMMEQEGDVQVSAGFEMVRSLKAMPALRGARAVDMGYVMRAWKWIRENV